MQTLSLLVTSAEVLIEHNERDFNEDNLFLPNIGRKSYNLLDGNVQVNITLYLHFI